MVKPKDKGRHNSRLGSSYRSKKFNRSKNSRDGTKRHGHKLGEIVPSKKIKRFTNDSLQNCSNSGNNTGKSERGLDSSDSESSNSEDSFLQLVNAVSDSKHSNISIISDESDLEEPDVDGISHKIENEHEKSSEESEDDDHGDIFDADESKNILQSIKEGTEDLSEDPFNIHLQHDLSDDLYEAVSSEPPKVEEHVKTWPTLGNLKIVLPKISESTNKIKSNSSLSIEETRTFAKPGNVPTPISNVDWTKLHLKSQIHNNVLTANIRHTELNLTNDKPLSDLQKELFSVINNYQDLYYTNRTLDNGEQIRFLYTLHAVNHALKTRLKVIHHNTRLSNRQEGETDIPDDFRDQGLTRPKVLILVPFRDSAFRIVQMMISILNLEESGNVMKKKRFLEEFTGEEIAMPLKNPKPTDYERTFTGNTDDTFRIGISVTKKSLKLYADFYSADIIISSPLGLRLIVGAVGEAERDFDFLASIEVLVLDQTEIFLMQNWDHLLHVLDHMHLQPKESHGTSFARIRSWALNGWSKYYRQTLVFTLHPLPQISSLVNKKCHNYRGKVCAINPVISGSICQVVLQLPQVFHKIQVDSAIKCIDERFEVFINKILPQYREPLMSHTLIFIPSYFDYVRLRNYFKKETISFTQICEYSKENKIARARDMFFHSGVHFMLYSERFHFFRRIRLKGIRHILFYQPPTFPHFYSEMCNFMQDLKKKNDTGGELNMSVSVLYSKFDAPQLAAIVGSARAAKMLTSDRQVHMFMTGE